jgi:MFS family permease
MSASSIEKGDCSELGQVPIVQDNFEVTLEPENNPQNLSGIRKWTVVLVISSAALCVTCASSIVSFTRSLVSYLILFKASFTEAGISTEFGVSKEVTILGLSLFVMGLGLGPLLVGPLSEVYGRNIIYQLSYLFFFIFSWPVAFAPNIGMHQVVFIRMPS